MGREFRPSERWKQRSNEMYNPGRGEEILSGPIFWKMTANFPLKSWQDSNPSLTPIFSHYFSTFLSEILSLFSQTFHLIGAAARFCLIHSYPRNPWRPFPKFPLGQPKPQTLHKTSRRGRGTRCLFKIFSVDKIIKKILIGTHNTE